ncbi:rod shape-determining protein MreD [Proteinivorax hydrogeniformans]|uniref:Rod shape-determining protein MreD n=1 Tax=Proteinivorax hydrogeniformans TaxID=1826727 RepID=A0AAU8HWL6_9FIRM
MGGLISILVILVLVTLQGSFLPLFSINGIVADLSLIFIVMLSLKKGNTYTLLLAAWAGLLQDVVFLDFIGVNIAAKVFTSYIIINFKDYYYKDNLLMTLLTLVYATFIHQGITHYFMTFVDMVDFGYYQVLLNYFAPLLILNLITLIIFYLPLKKFISCKNFYQV